MNKKILAISMAVTLAASLMMVPVFNVQAQVTSESRVLATILSLTEQAKNKINDNIIPTVDTVQEDLKFKQKFYQFEFSFGGTGTTVPVFVQVDQCELKDQTACAFNVESIQLIHAGVPKRVLAICVDDFGSCTDISDQGIITPTNLLVDTGIGKIGASRLVAVKTDPGFTGSVEVTGEKPQGMKLFIGPD